MKKMNLQSIDMIPIEINRQTWVLNEDELYFHGMEQITEDNFMVHVLNINYIMNWTIGHAIPNIKDEKPIHQNSERLI